jgi:hypothetical protein
MVKSLGEIFQRVSIINFNWFIEVDAIQLIAEEKCILFLTKLDFYFIEVFT